GLEVCISIRRRSVAAADRGAVDSDRIGTIPGHRARDEVPAVPVRRDDLVLDRAEFAHDRAIAEDLYAKRAGNPEFVFGRSLMVHTGIIAYPQTAYPQLGVSQLYGPV